MAGSAAAFLARLRRPSAGAALSPAEQRLADRSTSDAIDRAVRLERWTHAERLVRAAAEIEPKSPRLVERLARVRLAQGDPRGALELIEGAGFGSPLPVSVRLLRAACLVHKGARDEAVADLRRWIAEKTAPLDAGVVLALLEWHAGDEHAATLTLLRNVRWLEHPESLELLLLIAMGGERHEQADVWARRLADANRQTFGAPSAGPLSTWIGTPPATDDAAPSPDHVVTLARELRVDEPVIPALVEAQRRQPEPEAAALLAAAIETTLDDLRAPDIAFEALATLAIVRTRPQEARRWVDEGLRVNPRSLALARLDRELTATVEADDDVLATIGPTSETHPTTPEQAA